jgi:non-specific serine/threonine protein kinase
LLGPGAGEQWVTTYLHAVSGFALFQMPGREADCEAALRRALHGKQELGDVIGMAYALGVLGWLSAKTGSPAQSAWLLGAADPLWERGGSLRYSGAAIMEEFHQQAQRSAREALGVSDYAVSYAAGTGYVRERLNAGPFGGALRLEIP